VGPRLVRAIVLVVCALGVVGMIVASALDANGAALTFGLVTVSAVVCLIVATAVSGEASATDEQRAERVEGLISDLVAGGADESAVRNLVPEVRQGRSARP
jgi:hypothetical protein